MGLRVFCLSGQSAPEIFGGFLQVAALVEKRPIIDERIDSLRIYQQCAFVGFERFGLLVMVGFILQRGGQPVVGSASAHDPHFFIELASFKVQYKLAGKWFEAGSAAFDDHIFTVGKNEQLGQRRLNLGEFFAKSGKSAPQAVGRNSTFGELLDCAEANQVAEIVRANSLLAARRNKAQTVPIIQLLASQTENALDFVRAKSIRRTHENLAGGFLSCALLRRGLNCASGRLLAYRLY